MKRVMIWVIKRVLYGCVDALKALGVQAGVYLTTLGNEVILIEGGGEK